MFKFSENINEFLKIITKSAQNSNVRVFFVGGIVRDILLGKQTKDIDIIIEGNAINFCKNNENLFKIKSIHQDFGTVKIEYKDLQIDIASTRAEIYPESGCLPIVTKIGIPIEEDVKRRDFTINSMYIELKNINNEIQYDLIDLLSSQEDLKNKTLRILHDKSYIDDPTRIIRGVNFKHRFGFDFSYNDKKLIESYLKNIDRKNMSFDRISSVFKLSFLSEVYLNNFKYIIENKFYKILNDIELNIDYNKITNIINAFELKQKEISEFLYRILINQEKNIEAFSKNIDIINHFSKLENDEIAYYYFKTNDKNAIKYLSIKDIKLLISGKDLINLGYSKGKLLGEILNNLLEEKLNNSTNFRTIENEIEWILNNYPKI